MATKTLELTRTGIHGQAGTVVTEKDIDEIIETYVSESAPIVIWPHEQASFAPSLGTVIGPLKKGQSTSLPKEKALFGDVSFHPVLEKAYEEGLYKQWSIGAKRRAEDGKRYLHHLKMCGADPAAVKGLSDLTKDLMGLESINLSDFSDAEEFPQNKESNFKNKNKQNDPGKTGSKSHKEEKMDKILAAIEAIADEEEKKVAKAAYEELLKLKDNPPAAGGDGEKLKSLEDEIKRLRDLLKGIAEKYPQEDISLSDVKRDPEVAALMDNLRKTKRAALLKAAEEIVPKGLEKDLILLSDTFDIKDTIELSDSEKASGYEIFTKILNALPRPNLTGEILLSDPADDAGGSKLTKRDYIKKF